MSIITFECFELEVSGYWSKAHPGDRLTPPDESEYILDSAHVIDVVDSDKVVFGYDTDKVLDEYTPCELEKVNQFINESWNDISRQATNQLL